MNIARIQNVKSGLIKDELTSISPIEKRLASDYFDLNGLCIIGHRNAQHSTVGTPEHIHLDNIEIRIMIKGNDSYIVDGKEYLLSGGVAIISPPGIIHKSTNYQTGIYEEIWLQINPKADNILNLSCDWSKELTRRLLSLGISCFSVNNEFLNLAKKCFNAVYNKDDTFLQMSLLISLLNQLLQFSQKPIQYDKKMQEIMDYINLHFCEAINIEKICRDMNISRSWLHKNFNKQTPMEYVNYLRVEKAKELLKTDMSLTEIAFKVGFNSSSYFSTIFKKFMVITPTHYRKYH